MKTLKELRGTIVPKFWEHFIPENENDADEFSSAVSYLYTAIQEYDQKLNILEEVYLRTGTTPSKYGESTLKGLFQLHLRAALYSQLPLGFQNLTKKFYSRAFQAFNAQEQKDDGKLRD